MRGGTQIRLCRHTKQHTHCTRCRTVCQPCATADGHSFLFFLLVSLLFSTIMIVPGMRVARRRPGSSAVTATMRPNPIRRRHRHRMPPHTRMPTQPRRVTGHDREHEIGREHGQRKVRTSRQRPSPQTHAQQTRTSTRSDRLRYQQRTGLGWNSN